MQQQQPSTVDAYLVDTLGSCISAVIEQGRVASARKVVGAAIRNLRRCVAATDSSGFDAAPYSSGVESLERQFADLEEQWSF